MGLGIAEINNYIVMNEPDLNQIIVLFIAAFFIYVQTKIV